MVRRGEGRAILGGGERYVGAVVAVLFGFTGFSGFTGN